MEEITIVECAPRDGIRLGKGNIPLKDKSTRLSPLSIQGLFPSLEMQRR